MMLLPGQDFRGKWGNWRNHNNFVYLDKTWVKQNYTVGRYWTDSRSKEANRVKQPTGKGSWLIILQARTKNGFVDNAELIFQAKCDGDYHKPMNSAVFERWFRKQLLPNIQPNSGSVLDNATYYSTSWKKAEIKDWLVKKGAQPSTEKIVPVI